MSTKSVKPATGSIVIILEIFHADGKGNRKLILSGAPRDEMPELRVSTFAERHSELDKLWITLMKRKPQPIKGKSTGAASEVTATDTDKAETAEDATAATDEAQAEFEKTVAAAASETESAPVREAEPAATGTGNSSNETGGAWNQNPLPIIENDPTLEVQHG